MKTFIFALIGLLGVTLAAPLAEARDRDHHHSRDRHHRHHDHDRYSRYDRHNYRSYGPRYFAYPRYGYSDRYYYDRGPVLSFSFGR
jgi:hypothetical protein